MKTTIIAILDLFRFSLGFLSSFGVLTAGFIVYVFQGNSPDFLSFFFDNGVLESYGLILGIFATMLMTWGVQAINDYSGSTVGASSDIQSGVKRNREGAQQIGEDLAKKLSEKKVKEGIFDRNGYVYHGLVSAIAEGVRKGGVKV